MRKMVLAALAALILLGGPARADDARGNVLIKFADVLAIAGRCDRLTPNMKVLKLLALGYDIDVSDGSADHQILQAMVQGKRVDIAGNSDDEVCAIGVMLYGQNGMNMENLLVSK